jgi:cytochrome b
MSAANRVRVWDPAVRIGHWLLVALFATAYASGEIDGDLHPYAGYGVGLVVAFRLVWGFVGTRTARFAEFLRGPAQTLAYLRAFAAGRPPHFLGHNPAGGWMIVLLLAMLALTTWTGLETYGAQGHGPLAQASSLLPVAHADGARKAKAKRFRSSREKFWKELHEALANATLALVLLHVAGALVASLVHRENLVKAMVTGDKEAPPG